MLNTQLVPATSNRVLRSLALRTQEAGDDAFATVPAQVDNNDEAKYADKCGTYTKGIQQSAVGLVDLAAYQTFKHALSTVVLNKGSHHAHGAAGAADAGAAGAEE